MVITHKAPQKPHRKSRLGCKTCKIRKIKCDETRPVCGNCTRRFANASSECEFEILVPPAPRNSLSFSLPSTSKSASNFSSRSLELRLFHHYSTITSLTMPMCEEPSGLRMWSIVIPNIAFDSHCVYSAILGISALHLLALKPADVVLSAAVYHYIDTAVTSQRALLASLDNNNSIALFTAAVLLTMCSKLRSIWLQSSDEDYILPLNSFHLQAGLEQLFVLTRDYLAGSGIWGYVECATTKLVLHDKGLTMEETPRFDFPEDSFLDSFAEVEMIDEKREACGGVIEHLLIIKEGIRRGEEMHLLQQYHSVLPSKFSKMYLHLLGERDPIALAILARVFAVIRGIQVGSDPWWLLGTAEYEVCGIMGLVGGEWAWAMEWPLAVLELGEAGDADRNYLVVAERCTEL